MAGNQLVGGWTHLSPLNRMSAFAAEFANVPPGIPTAVTPSPPGLSSALPERYYGTVLIRSTVPVVVGALQVLLPEGKLVTASVAAVID